jgi:uncharacterized membrane protein YbjE (DUF340 family)
MFLVGIVIGSDSETWQTLKSANVRVLLVPLSVIVGTFCGVSVMAVFIKELSIRESLAIGAGFGYYSLSSVIITGISGKALGVIALLTNISREIITLIAAPLICKYFGKLAPIASGGATSMDTTLPIIIKSSGKEFAIISIFNGIVLTILVPFLIALIL